MKNHTHRGHGFEVWGIKQGKITNALYLKRYGGYPSSPTLVIEFPIALINYSCNHFANGSAADVA
ncbi:MAG: hypothetical protein KME23_03955 [Goleter apudmare HA4340-LM2]|nr:hypothetical protein [Goleter apudmare HA4340-LM2]